MKVDGFFKEVKLFFVLRKSIGQYRRSIGQNNRDYWYNTTLGGIQVRITVRARNCAGTHLHSYIDWRLGLAISTHTSIVNLSVYSQTRTYCYKFHYGNASTVITFTVFRHSYRQPAILTCTANTERLFEGAKSPRVRRIVASLFRYSKDKHLIIYHKSHIIVIYYNLLVPHT